MRLNIFSETPPSAEQGRGAGVGLVRVRGRSSRSFLTACCFHTLTKSGDPQPGPRYKAVADCTRITFVAKKGAKTKYAATRVHAGEQAIVNEDIRNVASAIIAKKAQAKHVYHSKHAPFSPLRAKANNLSTTVSCRFFTQQKARSHFTKLTLSTTIYSS